MRQRGYTMIELMVVMFLVALLMLLAVMSYRNYVRRSGVSEGFILASPAKIAVGEYVDDKLVLPPNQNDTGCTGITPTVNVACITIANDGSGEIIITYTMAGNGTIVLKPEIGDKRITWSCKGGDFADSV